MFKSMKMNLKNKLTDSDELTRIRNKLYQFLDKNPEVDHFLSDHISRKITMGALIGFLVGFSMAVFFCLIMSWIQLDVWHAQGYLHIPGSIFWK